MPKDPMKAMADIRKCHTVGEKKNTMKWEAPRHHSCQKSLACRRKVTEPDLDLTPGNREGKEALCSSKGDPLTQIKRYGEILQHLPGRREES